MKKVLFLFLLFCSIMLHAMEDHTQINQTVITSTIKKRSAPEQKNTNKEPEIKRLKTHSDRPLLPKSRFLGQYDNKQYQEKIIANLKKKNEIVANFIEKNKANNLQSPDHFCENIMIGYYRIERDVAFIDDAKQKYELEMGILQNYYNAALVLYNAYSPTTNYLKALKGCSALCSDALKKPFAYTPFMTMPNIPWIARVAQQTYAVVIRKLQITQDMAVKLRSFKGDAKIKPTIEELQRLLLVNYRTINEFVGIHQKKALEHYYQIAQELFEQNKLALAYQTVDDALAKEWQNAFANEVTALKSLRKSMIVKEGNLIEGMCQKLTNDMRLYKSYGAVKDTFLKCCTGFLEFLKRIEDNQEKQKYANIIIDFCYELAQYFMMEGAHDTAMHVLNAGSPFFSIKLTIEYPENDWPINDLLSDPIDLPDDLKSKKE